MNSHQERQRPWIAGVAIAAVLADSGSASEIRANGEIWGWGDSVIVGQGSLENLAAVAGGGRHSLGLKSDGSIIAWGTDQDGQCSVPAPNTGFLAVGAGSYCSFGLKGGGLVEGPEPSVLALRLYPNHPNPFNPRTTLTYEMPQAGPARLRVFDIRGRLIRTLVDRHVLAGRHDVLWDGRDGQDLVVPSVCTGHGSRRAAS